MNEHSLDSDLDSDSWLVTTGEGEAMTGQSLELMCDQSLYKYPSPRENHNDKQITGKIESQATVFLVNIHHKRQNPKSSTHSFKNANSKTFITMIWSVGIDHHHQCQAPDLKVR